MKSPYRLWALLIGWTLVVAACAEDQKTNAGGSNDAMLEPLIGVDTTKPLITAEEDLLARDADDMGYQQATRWRLLPGVW